MTDQELRFRELQETRLHNRNMEDLTQQERTEQNRTNLANEALKYQSNIITDAHYVRSDNENVRSHLANEQISRDTLAETVRSHKAQEDISREANDINWKNAYTNQMNAVTNRMNAGTNYENMLATREHYQNQDLLGFRTLDEVTLPKTHSEIVKNASEVEYNKSRSHYYDETAATEGARRENLEQQTETEKARTVKTQKETETEVTRQFLNRAQLEGLNYSNMRALYGVLNDMASWESRSQDLQTEYMGNTAERWNRVVRAYGDISQNARRDVQESLKWSSAGLGIVRKILGE